MTKIPRRRWRCTFACFLTYEHKVANFNDPRGCLPPALLIETLRTYDLLFPRTDGASQDAPISDAIKRDAAFANALSIYSPHQSHKTPWDARGPANVHDLYQRYPHWGERLHVLWKEIENPTPMTGVEKWTEKRRGHFWTTWWGIMGVAAAIVSLIITMGLGGVQVWIGTARGWKMAV